MDREMLKQHLEQAERHVAQGEKHIKEQRERVANLERLRADSSKQSLFEDMQKLRLGDRDPLRRELAD
jgi:hypothetical protein